MTVIRRMPWAVACVVLVASLAPSLAWGHGSGHDEWADSFSGYYHDGAYWADATAPTEDDTVTFGVDGTYTVSWNETTGDRTTRSVTVSAGNVTLSPLASPGSPYTWTVTDASHAADLFVTGAAFGVGTPGAGVIALDIDDAVRIGHAAALAVGWGSAVTCGRGLDVGYEGTGKLTIEDGGQVTAKSYGYLGLSAGSAGTATVTGAGSTWRIASNLDVGYEGTGKLTIEDGGQVTAKSYGYLGLSAGSAGTATVTGAGSTWRIASNLDVGYEGTGKLTIEDGGQVTAKISSYLGLYASSTGTATVTGAGSTWSIANNLYVGYEGTGTLTIEDGGQATVEASSTLGYYAGSTGTATVTGTASALVVDGILHVGYDGTGTLTVTDGGHVTVGDALGIGDLGTLNLAGGRVEAGALDHTDGGTLSYVLSAAGGTVPVTVTGDAALASVLGLALADGYLPVYGNSFRILDATIRTGRFSAVSGAIQGDDLALAVLYDATGVDVVAALPGDVTLDGTVDTADYFAMAAHWYHDGDCWATGDLNGDGACDTADYFLMADHWFDAVPMASGGPLPEPASLALLVVGVLAVAHRRAP